MAGLGRLERKATQSGLVPVQVSKWRLYNKGFKFSDKSALSCTQLHLHSAVFFRTQVRQIQIKKDSRFRKSLCLLVVMGGLCSSGCYRLLVVLNHYLLQRISLML